MVYSWACRRNQCMYNYLRNTHFFLSYGFMNQSHHRIHVRCRQNWDNFLHDHTGLASTITDRDCHGSTLRRLNNEEWEDVYPCIIWQRPANLIQFRFKLINLLVNHSLDTRNARLDKSLQMLQTTMFCISSRHYLHNWFLHSAIGPLITDFKRWTIYCATFKVSFDLKQTLLWHYILQILTPSSDNFTAHLIYVKCSL